MKNLGNIVRMYFQCVSSYNILRGQLDYKAFGEADFQALALQEFSYFSDTESYELYQYLRDCIGNENTENGLSVFRALKVAAGQYLTIQDNQPICDYDKLFEWRELTRSVGEDFCVCAFLADETERKGIKWGDFEWNVIIGHDNAQLNSIMRRGISDNHFHLFGSAPVFHLSWIRLMNQLDNSRYINGLCAIDQKKRKARMKYSVEYQETSMEKMHFQAALIRVVLFYYINMAKQGRWVEAKKVIDERDKIQNLLLAKEDYIFYRKQIQCDIDSIGMMSTLLQNDMSGDYANLGYYPRSMNHEFEGERALLYQMLLGTVNGHTIPDFLMNWFYAYMVIQVKFREELVQVNDTIGFANFSLYSGRKSFFLYSKCDDRKMVQHAVASTFEPKNVHKLEVRITPGRTAGANAMWISTCDNYIMEELGEQQLKNIYYVLHFPKRKDGKVTLESGYLDKCRHNRLRNELEKKGDELIRFRNEYPEEAARVLGIDACAQEIGCRPEVFASVFRQLGDHVANNPLYPNVKQWKRTFHVGEDWLDIVDGLRAVDEAILFLNMKKGERLGHATVLGIDVRAWYKKKKRSLRLPLQDYLDNVVWLYHKLIDFKILNCETLKGYLQREYERCFKKLYGTGVLMEKYYGMDTYYEAWQLRGDNPRLYGNEKYEQEYIYFYPYWMNETISRGNEMRREPAVIELLYNYHYSAEVRCSGELREEIEIPEFYIDGVVQIQKAMQRFVAQKMIFIEANPSSNLLISTMAEYADHPMLQLYNMGLTYDSEQLRACAQVHISINTDDKGVFQTSLENEFALMGCALEQMVDENGEKKYPKQMVYDWIEKIRENGNQQSFLRGE